MLIIAGMLKIKVYLNFDRYTHDAILVIILNEHTTRNAAEVW